MGRHKERVTIQVQLETETGEHDALLKWIDDKKLSREWKETFLKAMNIIAALEQGDTRPVRDHYPKAYYALVDGVRNKTISKLGEYINATPATPTPEREPEEKVSGRELWKRFQGLEKI